MLNQDNISNCLLLLQQQISLQNEINKYCSLMTMFDNTLDLLKITNTTSVNTNLDYVVAALTDAKSSNISIINELQEQLQLLIRLSKNTTFNKN